MARKQSIRGFREVRKQFKKFDTPTTLPVRADNKSAGYDLFSKETRVLAPGETRIFWTDVRAYMQPNEVLLLFVRSSLGVKLGINLANSVGIIDASYYGNKENDGNIGIALTNNSRKTVTITKDMRIGQAIFMDYLLADKDETLKNEREGGFGSSDKQ